MPRYRLTIEYDGTPFVGWQIQAAGLSVQGVLTEAVRRLSGERVRLTGAGRTDAGVHALGQVAHFDLSRDWRPDTLREGLNAHLRPHPVAVLVAEAAADDFDARFSATRRHYRYVVVNRRAPLTVARDRAWRVIRPLDAGAMHDAAQLLVGRHDFTTFRAAECQANSPVKTLDRLTVTRAGAELAIEACARSFLHHQIRSITGSLVQVGIGKWTAADLRAALEARDRSRCGPMAPPDGLYLTAVEY
ncbi:tRNA pseudouridine(38-40) synthase TruA [Blastochloris viridis]|uniref:tRNA pseudouridine synthase A n=1 Tax=Blastochloris viridis TaxID=1079 RepID=A0A0H5B894_BLAVI|nr:tRNA pseudouridine(38-40) synthase TruA [Blastochloris viridis]ALK08323.1 tRNA pseudouridine synthase A [Blastochloris viridis]BAR98407.1 tRNA pseudouridine synthase A [Blastochloris viridis]CUU44245.1 tRNA pseudouridine synthase A [Blastochloris viridis]